MISNLANIFKIPDLRNKLLFVIMIVVIYRLGVAIRVPGVDGIAIEQLRESANQTSGARAARSRADGGIRTPTPLGAGS